MGETSTAVTSPANSNIPIPDPSLLTTEQLRRELLALRELLEGRMAAQDAARALHLAALREDRAAIRREITALAELHEEKFAGIAQQFAERDIRAQQTETAGREALAAALLAQKELQAQQNEANVLAAEKVEASTARQIEQTGLRLTELKERIDRGEGSTTGATAERGERRLDLGQLMQLAVTIAAVISLILVAFRH